MQRSVRACAIAALALLAAETRASDALERVQPRAERLLAETRGGPSEILYVGPGGAPCDFADLDDALAAAQPNAEIRLTPGPFSGPFVTGEKSLAIVGGFATCSDTVPVGRSNLVGNGSATVMTLLSSDGAASISLDNLLIEDGDGPFAGGLDIRGGIDVVIRNVLIRLSDSDSNGGGIRVAHSTNTDGALVVMLEGTNLIDNTAADSGGGLACLGNGGNQHVVVLDNGRITGNDATRGGGIYAENCTFLSMAGGDSQGIDLNFAEFGGGIYGVDSSQILLDGTAPGFLTPGNPDAPAILAANNANQAGGGVVVSGPDTLFQAVDAVIADNTALRAAAIDSWGSADLLIKRGSETKCRRIESPANQGPCSRIRDNVSQESSVISMAGDGATARISQTFIHGNRIDLDAFVGNLIQVSSGVDGLPTELTIEGSVIDDNLVNNSLIGSTNDSDLRVLWSTIAGNDFRGEAPQAWVFLLGSGPGEPTFGPRIIYGSIVHQPGIVMTDPGDPESFFFFCNVAHDLDFQGQTSQSIAADPLFVNPAAGNYHIEPDSPAVDFCPESSWPPEDPDIDGETRGVPASTGTSTPFDAGADEALDRLFADRFID